MALFTKFLKLLKPEKNDYVDVEKHLSENYDKIDSEIEKLSDSNDKKLDKANVSEEYNTAEKIETKIKEAKKAGTDAGTEANKKLDKANVSEEYNTAEKIETKIKEAKKAGTDAGTEANKKLDKGNVSENYNTAEKIELEVKKKFDKAGGTVAGDVVAQKNLVVNGTISCKSFVLNGYTVTIEE